MSSAAETTRLAVLGHERRREEAAEVHELALAVPAGLRWLRGHFDGHPILPAVVQLWEVELHARAIWPELGTPRRITRAKFRRPIRPGDRLALTLRRPEGKNQAAFEYRRAGEICSSGTIAFRPPEDGR